MSDVSIPHTFVTEQQAVIHALFRKHRSMSIVARLMNLSPIRVREALVQHQRNTMRDAGQRPPSLKAMLRGDVTVRFGVPRSENGGRPAKHAQLPEGSVAAPASPPEDAPILRRMTVARGTVQRLIVTAVEPDREVHRGFWRNLQAYAAYLDAELVVASIGKAARHDHYASYREHVLQHRIVLDGALDLALDAVVSSRNLRPLDGLASRNEAAWTIVPSPAIQLETLPRMRADGIRVQMTTGAMTKRGRMTGAGDEVGATIIEISGNGAVHCRHLLSSAGGDGAFQDLDRLVSRGAVLSGSRVETITFGDIHHIHLDPTVAAATWGIGSGKVSSSSLIDRLRPRAMIFHDVCDFDARSHHDARNHHRRFAQLAAGGGDVKAELTATAGFLGETRRDWSRSIVVGSNHDSSLVRWLADADYREDPLNALFYLETSLEFHRRLAAGHSADGFFEQTLRRLSSDGLSGVRFLQTAESLRLGGVECAIHGHLGADGRPGDMRFFERLGIKATLGHTHRPTTRGGIYCAGVCQTELYYARGPVTSWGVGHVVAYATGARQHLIFVDGTFHA